MPGTLPPCCTRLLSNGSHRAYGSLPTELRHGEARRSAEPQWPSWLLQRIHPTYGYFERHTSYMAHIRGREAAIHPCNALRSAFCARTQRYVAGAVACPGHAAGTACCSAALPCCGPRGRYVAVMVPHIAPVAFAAHNSCAHACARRSRHRLHARAASAARTRRSGAARHAGTQCRCMMPPE